MDKRTDLAEWYDKIYRYCYFKVHSRETAEDITQEAFTRCLEYYGHRGKEWDIRYLYRIAHNLCVDEWRRPSIRAVPEDHVEYMAHAHSEGGQEGSDHAEDIVTAMWLREAIAGLSEEEREILLLRYANEAPDRVICEMLGISRFALYRRVQRALQKLREEWENE